MNLSASTDLDTEAISSKCSQTVTEYKLQIAFVSNDVLFTDYTEVMTLIM